MTENKELHVVIGASGGLGNAVVRELVDRRKLVRAVNRSGKADVPDGVEVVKGDVTDNKTARQVCQGATVVYNCANPPYTKWPEMFPPILDGIIEGAASAEAKLVFGDNLYMYGPVEGPISEDLPYNAAGRKGKTRAQMAKTLMEAHKSGKVRATIGRASAFFGPGVINSSMGEQVFGATLRGKKVKVLGNLDVPHTYTFVRDFGKGLVTLGEREEAIGKIWHIPSAETLTTRQFLELIFEEAGKTPKVMAAPRFLVKMMGLFNPIMRELKEMLYEFEKPYIVDHSKYKNIFGEDTTPHREAIRQTLDWYRKHPG